MKKTDDKAKGRLKGLSLFANVGIAEARPFNIGLHFGTRAAALSRIAYLRESGRAVAPRPPHCRLLTCELTLNNPFRLDDVFGHSYAGILAALESEVGRGTRPACPSLPPLAALQRRFDRLTARYLAADDNPRFAADSYYVFTSRQVSSIGEEMVKYNRSRRAA